MVFEFAVRACWRIKMERHCTNNVKTLVLHLSKLLTKSELINICGKRQVMSDIRNEKASLFAGVSSES